MKNWRNGFSNILALVFLVGLAALMVAIFNDQGLQSAGPGSSPVPTAVGAQASPLSTPVGSSAPLARIGKPILLKSIDQLGAIDNGQDKFTSIVGQGEAARTIVLDPTTGTIQTITTTALWNAHVAGRWLAYVDHAALTAAHHYRRIKVLDLETGKEVVLGDENALQDSPSISGDIVVWDESVNGRISSIYAYDLATSKKFPVIVKPGSRGYPQISGQWVVYVQWPGQNPTGQEPAIELHAYSLKTNEDILIGLIPSPKNAGWGTYHAVDGDKVVWSQAKADGRSNELHVYDLTARTDRKLLGPGPLDTGISALSISAKSGLIVFAGGTEGWGWEVLDWSQSIPTPVSVEPPPEVKSHSAWGYNLCVSGDYLIWRVGLGQDGADAQFFASPITR